MNIGICEDILINRQMIQEMIQKWAIEKGINAVFFHYDSGEALIDSDESLDLLFLDIHLPGIWGNEVAKTLRERYHDLEIVFCTAYNDYMRSALDIHAFGYLEKPVEREPLYKIMDDFIKMRYKNRVQDVYLKTEKGIEKIAVEDMLYFERTGRKLYLNTFKGKREIRMTLAAVFEKLEKRSFVYIHKGCIVNMMYIKKVVSDEITMDNGEVLMLARPRLKAFRESWFNYMHQNSGI